MCVHAGVNKQLLLYKTIIMVSTRTVRIKMITVDLRVDLVIIE